MDQQLGLAELSDWEVREMRRLGVTRNPIDSYTVGRYRYSSLREALAEGRRQEAT